MQLNDSNSAVQQLLLEDYRALADSFWKNEQTGETRVNLFIGLITAVAGGLVLMYSKDSQIPETIRQHVTIGALFALLILGLITWLRILTRNSATDRYKIGLDRVRQMFRDHFDQSNLMLHYYGFAEPHRESKDVTKTFEERTRKFGGLAHTLVAVNSLLTFSLMAAVARVGAQGILICAAAGLAGFVVSFAVQMSYMQFREEREKQVAKMAGPSHAGGIVYRPGASGVEYLLIRPKNDQSKWILPKGKIWSREGHAEAAIREVREETGVVVRLVAYVGRMDFRGDADNPNRMSTAKLYLMEAVYVDPIDANREHREVLWLPFAAARRALTHEESRQGLDDGEALRIARDGG